MNNQDESTLLMRVVEVLQSGKPTFFSVVWMPPQDQFCSLVASGNIISLVIATPFFAMLHQANTRESLDSFLDRVNKNPQESILYTLIRLAVIRGSQVDQSSPDDFVGQGTLPECPYQPPFQVRFLLGVEGSSSIASVMLNPESEASRIGVDEEGDISEEYPLSTSWDKRHLH